MWIIYLLHIANKKAWMTSQIFTELLAAWDLYLTKVNRKILLLVDNCTAHPHVSTLKNIQLELLPPNTTPLIQPMDQGIIKNLKTLYRKELVHTWKKTFSIHPPLQLMSVLRFQSFKQFFFCQKLVGSKGSYNYQLFSKSWLLYFIAKCDR